MPICKSTQWYIDNLYHVMLAWDHPWDPASINDAWEGGGMLPSDNEFDDKLYDYLRKINAA